MELAFNHLPKCNDVSARFISFKFLLVVFLFRAKNQDCGKVINGKWKMER